MRVPTPDWYAVLGVPPVATRAEIGSAFRKAMKTCHPDLFPGDEEKGARARALSSAKSVLGDEKRRAAYDEARSKPPPEPGATKPPPRAKTDGKSTEGKPAGEPKKKPTPKAARPLKKSDARPPKPKSSSRLAVEFLGQRRYAGRSWQQLVLKLYRAALKAQNPGKRFVSLRLATYTVKEPGVLEVRIAYGKGRNRVVSSPTPVRLYWAK